MFEAARSTDPEIHFLPCVFICGLLYSAFKYSVYDKEPYLSLAPSNYDFDSIIPINIVAASETIKGAFSTYNGKHMIKFSIQLENLCGYILS